VTFDSVDCGFNFHCPCASIALRRTIGESAHVFNPSHASSNRDMTMRSESIFIVGWALVFRDQLAVFHEIN
jgi:hypothetical protein